jgi:molybdenum cofactor cytidylyltransferase
MIAAVVPAAGRSRRMGRPKLLLNVGGQTLIHRVVTALRGGGAERVIVVAPPPDSPEGPLIAAEATRGGAEVLAPVARPAEMRQSVELGLACLRGEPPPCLVLLCPGDSPGITPGLVARLLDLAARRPDCIVVPCSDGHRGHPVVFPWEVAAEVQTLPPDEGINLLVARHRDRVIEAAVEESERIDDLDSPEDLRRWDLQPLRFHPAGDHPDAPES